MECRLTRVCLIGKTFECFVHSRLRLQWTHNTPDALHYICPGSHRGSCISVEGRKDEKSRRGAGGAGPVKVERWRERKGESRGREHRGGRGQSRSLVVRLL